MKPGPTRVFLATGNRHKVGEFRALLAGLEGVLVEGAEAVGGMPPVEETGATFAENALLKARALAVQVAGAGWVLADDSGLVVPALGGAPGIFSSRYAGPGATDADNRARLQREMAGLAGEQRRAWFHCSLAVLGPAGEEAVFEGRCEGRILEEPRGTGGFGYDALFVPDGEEQTFGELSPERKDGMSHRARAVGGWRASFQVLKFSS